MKNTLLKGALEGGIGSLVLVCSGTFLFLPFGRNISPILIGLFGACASSILYMSLAWSMKKNRELVCYSLVSCLSFTMFLMVQLTVRIIIPSFGMLRESDNADGIYLLFIFGTFFATSLLLKLCAFVVFIVRNIIHSTD